MRRFKIRQFNYGYRIIEIVSEGSHFGTLTIEWDGLFQTEASAKSHIDKVLRVSK